MRIAIFGTGGAAGYFGARLAEAGEDVAFIARGEHLHAIRQRGLRIESANGDVTIQPANATSDPNEIGPVDLVILGVKTWQVHEASKTMRPMIGPETAVLPLQNGVEASAQLSEELGAEHVLGGLARVISYVTEPGCLRQEAGPSEITLAELDNQPSLRVHRLCHALEHAGISVKVPANIQVALWAKFLFVASLGGLGATTRAPVGVLRRVPETRRILEAAMHEVLEVALAQGIPMGVEEIANAIAVVDSLSEDSTMSLQRDVVAGRPSELEAWNGSVVRLGEAAGVAVPIHSLLYGTLLPQEQRARGLELFD